MSFTISKLVLANDLGLGGTSAGSTARVPNHWYYGSSDDSTSIAAAGYFAGCGVGSRGNNAIGMRIGDILTNVESSGGANAGRVTVHSVKASSADQSSTTASTGFNTSYNITVSTTP